MSDHRLKGYRNRIGVLLIDFNMNMELRLFRMRENEVVEL